MHSTRLAMLCAFVLVAATAEAREVPGRSQDRLTLVPSGSEQLLYSISNVQSLVARETAGPDTFVLYGGPDQPLEGKFEDAQGSPDFNGWTPTADMMTRITLTDFFYAIKVFEMDARLDYKYYLDGSQYILDPLNPNQVGGSLGPNSELAMPDYVQPPEIQYYPGFDHGTVSFHTITSSVMGQTCSTARQA